MNATVKHTMENGTILQICLRCHLRVDDYGFPDPRYYSSDFMQRYYGTPKQDRCQHDRTTAPPVSEREKRFEKALYAALALIKEALFARERE